MEYVRFALIRNCVRKIEKGGSGWDYNLSLWMFTTKHLHLGHEMG
jgi:hypothetical protein